MTVIVSKPAVNLREELASLRNQGGYQEQQFYFDGLVTNGDFATNDLTGFTDLSTGTGSVTASSGAAQLVGTDSSNRSRFEQSISTVANKTYTLSFDITADAGGSINVSGGVSSGAVGNFDQTKSGVGSHSITFTPTGGSIFVGFRSNGATDITIDNISVFEVDANDDVIHTMPKGWVPKDVYEDGLLQREGSAHDYEVVYDGFDYFVKPTVAPSATTQTCVIGVKA